MPGFENHRPQPGQARAQEDAGSLRKGESVFGRVGVVVDHQRPGVDVDHKFRAAFVKPVEQTEGGFAPFVE
jgi:hypothetical protein